MGFYFSGELVAYYGGFWVIVLCGSVGSVGSMEDNGSGSYYSAEVEVVVPKH